MNTAIEEYSPIEAAISDLSSRHKGVVFDVTKPEQLKAAKAAAKDIAQYRIALEKKRVELKADVLDRGRLIDGEAKRIAAKLAELEDPIVDQIKAEERRIEAERAAAIKAEEERIAAEERARKEAEEKRLAEERAKIAAEREALERAQAAQREAEEKARREREEADRLARAKIEEEERAAKKRIEAAEADARAKRQAEEDRLRAEREAIDKERRAKEEAERREREAKEQQERQRRATIEAAEREAHRLRQEVSDGRELLSSFVHRFGHRTEFSEIAASIKEFLAEAEQPA